MICEVVKEVDKFENKTTISMSIPFHLSSSMDKSLKLKSIQSSGKIDSISIRYYKRCSDYFSFGGRDLINCCPETTEGKNMIIRINDNENISLPFGSEGRSVSKKFNEERQMYYNEYRVYNSVEINKMILEKICNATSIEFKLAGSECLAENCQGFINYCRMFYNGLYNEEKYLVDVDSLPAIQLTSNSPLKVVAALCVFLPLIIVIIIGLLTR